MKAEVFGITFTDKDVVEKNDFIPQGEYNPHNIHPWLLHANGLALCVVFASNLQDALDIAADDGRLDAFQVDESDCDDDENGYAGLGNDGEPFDIETLGFTELANPKFSFVAMYKAED